MLSWQALFRVPQVAAVAATLARLTEPEASGKVDRSEAQVAYTPVAEDVGAGSVALEVALPTRSTELRRCDNLEPFAACGDRWSLVEEAGKSMGEERMDNRLWLLEQSMVVEGQVVPLDRCLPGPLTNNV